MRYISFFILFSLLSACSSIPQSLQGEYSPVVSIKQAQLQPDTSTGHTIRWGGIIFGIENFTDHSLLEVIAYPLDNSARPVTDRPSLGRFLVHTPHFLDPAIHTRDREVSITGTLTRLEMRMIGEYEYQYPFVEAHTIYLWPERIKPDPYYYDPWYPWGPWYPWYPPHRHIP